jgi:hypothetical protein
MTLSAVRLPKSTVFNRSLGDTLSLALARVYAAEWSEPAS